MLPEMPLYHLAYALSTAGTLTISNKQDKTDTESRINYNNIGCRTLTQTTILELSATVRILKTTAASKKPARQYVKNRKIAPSYDSYW